MELSKVNKLLIVRLSSLGDILLTTPLIRALKNSYPRMQIDFLCKRTYKDIILNNPYLSNIFLYEKKGAKREALIERLLSEKYDLAADLQNNFRSRSIVFKLSCENIRFRKKSTQKFLLVKFKMNLLQDAPQIPYRYAGIFRDLRLDEKGLDLISDRRSFTEDSGDKFIGIAPGSRHFTKMWPRDYYIELCRMLISSGYRIVILGGRNDIEICCEIASKVPGSLNLCNSNDILQTAADMKRCLAVVCNDSGLMHAACAAGVPVLAFFGSTVREFGFYPYKNKNAVLENHGLYCRPCTHIGRDDCPEKHFKCMHELTPALAFRQLNFLLKS